jgi:hypothetical protein
LLCATRDGEDCEHSHDSQATKPPRSMNLPDFFLDAQRSVTNSSHSASNWRDSTAYNSVESLFAVLVTREQQGGTYRAFSDLQFDIRFSNGCRCRNFLTLGLAEP